MAFSITIKTLFNASATFPASLTDTVASLKVRVWEALLLHTGVAASMFHLVHAGQQVRVRIAGSGADATLADLFPGGPPAPPCAMHVVVRLGGHAGVMPDVYCEGAGSGGDGGGQPAENGGCG